MSRLIHSALYMALFFVGQRFNVELDSSHHGANAAPARTGNSTSVHTPQAIQWGPLQATVADGSRIPADTGWVTVPERHGKAGGATIRIPVMRLRSTSANPGTPIVYLAGGPGNAGLPSLQREFAPHLLQLRTHGDVILYDQRGTGRAIPDLTIAGRLSLPPGVSIASDVALTRFREIGTRAREELRGKGIDLDAYNTAESVEDLDDVRAAIGAERLVVWGHSYGSHLALAYLKAHEPRVQRLIIGGINGVEQRWRFPTDGDVLFRRIDSVLKSDARFRKVMPDFMGTVQRVLGRLEREPMHVTMDGSEHSIGRAEVSAVIALSGGDMEFIRRLPQMFARLDAGDASGVAPFVRGLRERPIGTGMLYSMHLASGVSADRAARIAKEAPSSILGNAINFPFDGAGVREAWGITDLGDAFRAPVRSAVPALLLSATFDGRVSLDDAARVRSGLSNAHQIFVDGASHNFYATSPRLVTILDDFVAGRPAHDEHISVAPEFRSPNELDQLKDMQDRYQRSGIDGVTTRLLELSRANDQVLTSYLPGTMAVQLITDLKKPADAVVLLNAAIPLFPHTTFLMDRLAEAYIALGDTTRAVDAWKRSVGTDPLNVGAKARLRTVSAPGAMR